MELDFGVLGFEEKGNSGGADSVLFLREKPWKWR